MPVLRSDRDGVVVVVDRPSGRAQRPRPSRRSTELRDRLRELATDTEVRVVVLTGAGERAFAAGADIKEMVEMSVLEAHAWGSLGHECARLLESMPKPTIAAVNGFALGGGCELALACDIRYASDRAKFGQPEISLAVIPGWGGTQRLARAVGPALAKDLILTGRTIDADEALRIGLVSAVHPAGSSSTGRSRRRPGWRRRARSPSRRRRTPRTGRFRATSAPGSPTRRCCSPRCSRPTTSGGHARLHREARPRVRGALRDGTSRTGAGVRQPLGPHGPSARAAL